jgi:hypothetical protein
MELVAAWLTTTFKGMGLSPAAGVSGGKDEAGTENATRTSGTGLEGEYDGAGKNPNGTTYKVKITVEPAGNLYRFVWSNNTDGVGIKQGDNVAVGIGGARCGFVAYEIKSDGWKEFGADTEATGRERRRRLSSDPNNSEN